MWSHRHCLRRIATLMVAVWLFALGTGVVHACRAGLPAAGDPAVHDHAAETVADGLGGAVPAAGEAPCAKFCDDEANSLPTLKLATDTWVQAAAWGRAEGLAVAASAGPALSRATGALPSRARVPIPIAFLRLTL